MLDWPTSSPQMMTMFGFAAWAVASPGAAIHIVSSNISNKTTLFIWASIRDMGRVCPRYVCLGPRIRHRTLVPRLTRPIFQTRTLAIFPPAVVYGLLATIGRED